MICVLLLARHFPQPPFRSSIFRPQPDDGGGSECTFELSHAPNRPWTRMSSHAGRQSSTCRFRRFLRHRFFFLDFHFSPHDRQNIYFFIPFLSSMSERQLERIISIDDKIFIFDRPPFALREPPAEKKNNNGKEDYVCAEKDEPKRALRSH